MPRCAGQGAAAGASAGRPYPRRRRRRRPRASVPRARSAAARRVLASACRLANRRCWPSGTHSRHATPTSDTHPVVLAQPIARRGGQPAQDEPQHALAAPAGAPAARCGCGRGRGRGCDQEHGPGHVEPPAPALRSAPGGQYIIAIAVRQKSCSAAAAPGRYCCAESSRSGRRARGMDSLGDEPARNGSKTRAAQAPRRRLRARDSRRAAASPITAAAASPARSRSRPRPRTTPPPTHAPAAPRPSQRPAGGSLGDSAGRPRDPALDARRARAFEPPRARRCTRTCRTRRTPASPRPWSGRAACTIKCGPRPTGPRRRWARRAGGRRSCSSPRCAS
jgi:hypothetical protein